MLFVAEFILREIAIKQTRFPCSRLDERTFSTIKGDSGERTAKGRNAIIKLNLLKSAVNKLRCHVDYQEKQNQEGNVFLKTTYVSDMEL